jgi:hypothetical protein
MTRWLSPGGVGFCMTVLALAGPFTSLAAELAYVADMVQRGPQGVVSTGRLYVSGDRRRIEVTHGSESMVNITDPASGVALTLFPSKKSYTEQAVPVGGRQGERPLDPCAGNPGAQCRNLGEEPVAGRSAEKWEIRYQQQGMTLTAHQWIDRERQIPLRQEMPGGQSSELRLVGGEQLNGRSVEKWEMLSSQANKAPVRTYQWYDPQLRQAIKQELPGGYVSELRNIRVGAQDEALFRVPTDYEKLVMPVPPARPAE